MPADFHHCLAVDDRRPGDALDCPECRDELIKSFGEPVTTEETTSRETDPEALHHTTAITRPEEKIPGGTWTVTCPCGWSKSGRYARDGGERMALKLATLRGAEHEKNPDKRCAFCGGPEREARCAFCRANVRGAE